METSSFFGFFEGSLKNLQLAIFNAVLADRASELFHSVIRHLISYLELSSFAFVPHNRLLSLLERFAITLLPCLQLIKLALRLVQSVLT